MLFRYLRLAFLAVSFVWCVPSHADAISDLEHFFAATHSLKGQFVQHVYETKGTLLRTTSGVFELARPDQFSWEYIKPNVQKIISNGVKMWIYDKDLAQVTVTPVAKRLGQAPIMLLGGGEALTKNFQLSDSGTREGLNWVKLTPKTQRGSQFSSILLGIGGGLVRQMVLFDKFGHRTVLVLTALTVNQSLPAADFTFIPPQGVDVVNGM